MQSRETDHTVQVDMVAADNAAQLMLSHAQHDMTDTRDSAILRAYNTMCKYICTYIQVLRVLYIK